MNFGDKMTATGAFPGSKKTQDPTYSGEWQEAQEFTKFCISFLGSLYEIFSRIVSLHYALVDARSFA